MSLRTLLGADVDRVHEQVDVLLDREDAMILLIDSWEKRLARMLR